MTVTRGNLEGVPAALRCVVKNADAFKMIRFQPVSQVGRTEDGLGGVAVEDSGTKRPTGSTVPPRTRRS
jgi:hypothetical protein